MERVAAPLLYITCAHNSLQLCSFAALVRPPRASRRRLRPVPQRDAPWRADRISSRLGRARPH